MAQPTGYTPTYDFSDYSTLNPTLPHLGVKLDDQFEAIELTLDEILVNLALVQRDDGDLANLSVTTESLSSAVRALIAVGGSTIRGAWLTGTVYAISDVVTQGGIAYICLTAHTAGVFATDLAAEKWLAVTPEYTAFGAALITAADASAGLTVLGVSAFAKTVLDDANGAAVLTTLGVTATGQSILDDGSAAAVRTTIGLDTKANVLANASVLSGDSLSALTVDATGGAVLDKVPFIDASDADATNSVLVTDLVKNILANFTTKAVPVAGDKVIIGDSAASGAAKISTLAELMVYFQAALRLSPAKYLSGMKIERIGTTTFQVLAGSTANEDGGTQYDMILSSTFSKSLSTWAVGTGNGGLDTGAVGATTWYHVHIIRKDSDGSIDVLLSLSQAAPTMPGGYTARRRIGSIKTDGSSQIIAFSQHEDEFLWDVATIDLDAVNPGTSAVTRTLNVPTGVNVDAIIEVGNYGGTAIAGVNISSLDVSDQAAQAVATASLTGILTRSNQTGTSGWGFSSTRVRTNTSAQIRSRLSASGAADRLGIITRGWIDHRGK